MIVEAELFNSTHAALTFAYNFVGQPPLGALGRLIGGEVGSGKGLVGLDGAAQAGMILREVSGLGAGPEHIITARFAPRTIPCTCRAPCCCGHIRAERWNKAAAWITELAIGQLAGCVSNYRLRRGIVCRYFGERINMGELAAYAKCSRDTVTDQSVKIVRWLRREEHTAQYAIDARLKEAGIISRDA